jgi:hypothetical protein
MLQPSDAVVLFGLMSAEPGWTLRSVGDRLGVQHSKVQRAIERLSDAGIYDEDSRRVVPHAAEEFLVHALKYLHPIREGRLARGVPTAWAAGPLLDEISSSEPPPVWPDPRGTVRGQAVEPLDKNLPAIAGSWPEVAELASLADALRIGNARVRDAAARHMHERIWAER